MRTIYLTATKNDLLYNLQANQADIQLRTSFKYKDDDTGAFIGPFPFLLETPAIARAVRLLPCPDPSLSSSHAITYN